MFIGVTWETDVKKNPKTQLKFFALNNFELFSTIKELQSLNLLHQ